jgi:hypothetical protein
MQSVSKTDDLLQKYRLNRVDLKEIAYGHPVSDRFRRLIQEYYVLADEYRKKTCDVLKRIRPLLIPRYQLRLEIIFSLYLMVFERINVTVKAVLKPPRSILHLMKQGKKYIKQLSILNK